MTTHSTTDRRPQKSRTGNPRRRRKAAATAKLRKKGRLLRLEPLELRTLLSADVFEAVLGGPCLLSGEDSSPVEPMADVQHTDKSGPQESILNGSPEAEFPEAYSLCYDYEYVIITNNDLKSSFQPLLEQKQSRGLTGRIVTTEYIYANFSGTESGDNPDKIRDFIAFVHDDWGTEWVLLGGDVEIIPQRGVYAEYGGQLHHDLPTDLYYSCLEGPWNGDSDGVWGEVHDGAAGGEIDLVPEVYIGRAPVSNITETTNFVNKTVLYETTAHPNHDTAVWLGEQIDSNTWGAYSSMEIRDDVLPDNLNLIEHYELDGPWTGTQLRDDLNNSPHFVNNLSHSSEIYDSKLSLATVEALTNPFPYLIYSQGCDGGSFDTEDVSIAEQHVVAEHGAFAAIMNSRDGWYIPGSDPGASHRFAFSFWDAVFNEGKVHLGEANQAAKLDNLWRVGVCGYARWVYMETNLLGDPETPLQLNGLPQNTVNTIFGTVWNDVDGDGTQASESGLANQVVYADLNNNGQRDDQVSTFTSTDVPTAIPNPGTMTSQLVVSGGPATIQDVNVTLDITHPCNGNLNVFLISPSGARATLLRGVSGVNFDGTVLDDDSSTSIFDGSSPFNGTFRPEGLLSIFEGEDANGTWTLEITDDDGNYAGTLNSWSLEVSYVEPTTTTDAQGDYALPIFAAGTVTIRHELPTNWSYTMPGSGSHDVTLQGGTVEDINFGISEHSQPEANDDAIQVAEGSTSTVLVGGATNLLDNDTDLDLPEDTLTVNTTPVTNVSHGTLTLNPDGTFSYAHDGSENLSDSFVYEVSDSTGNTDSATVMITVSAVNDAPLLTLPAAQNAEEDVMLAITGIGVSDSDAAGGSVRIVMSVAHGRMTLAQTTGLTFTQGSGTDNVAMTFTGTVANVNAALATVNYLGNTNYIGAEALSIGVDDLGNSGAGGAKTDGGTVAIAVAAVNDAPVVTVPGAQLATEDATHSIAGISIADIDAATGSVRVTASVSHGHLTLAQTTGLAFTVGDGASDSSMTFTGTLTDVNAALATVTYAGNSNHFGADTLNISVNDQGNTGSGGAKSDSSTVAITVSGVNDAPILSVPGGQTTDVDTALGITGINIEDVDSGSGSMQVSVSATRGNMTLATVSGLTFTDGDGFSDTAMTMSGTRAAVNAALATLTYDPDAGYEGLDTVQLSVSDLGNTGSGGVLTHSGSILVHVGVVADLIAWWTVDETSGSVAADTSPFGATHNGPLQGDAQWTTMGLNGALQTDGNGDGVSIPNSNDFNLGTTTARTVSGWFFVADKSVNNRAQLLFEEGGDTRGLSIYVHDGQLYVGGWNRPSNESNWNGTFLNTDQIQSGQWHHVALVLNGTSTVTNDALRGYLDGVEFASGSGSQLWAHSAASAIGQAAAGFRLHSGFHSGGNGLEGMLDDMRIYNRALTASEVAKLASATLVEPQTLTVSIPDDSVAENSAAISGTVTRTGNLGSSLIVTLTSSDPGRLTVPTTVAFTAGQNSQSFQLTPQDNAIADGPADIVVTATAAGSASGQDALTVLDDELSDAGLVAYWAMNEGSGSTAADTSPYGRNHPGTLAGDTTWSPQGLGHSLQFDGFSDRLAVPNSSSINIAWATQRTVSLWFAVDDASISSRKQVLYEEGGSTRGINIYLDSGRLYVGGFNAPHESNWTGTFHSTDQIQSGQWHHVALVLNGGKTITPDAFKAYLDGTEIGSGSGSQLWTHSDAIGVGQVVQTTKFHDGDSGGGHGYAGLMDELRVYQRALSAAEIQTLASESMAANESLTVSITADSMAESSSSLATVTRSGDTSGALVVTLNSSDTLEATVPATVTIGAGQASASFTVTAQDDTVRDGDATAMITASATDMASGNDSILVTDDEEVLVNGVMNNVTNSWTTVTLPQDYVSMVVVATPSYTESHIPAVTRIRNATGNSFELRVDRTDSSTAAMSGVTVHYVVAEEGVYTAAQDGVTMEAVKYNSTVTDRRGNWVGQSRSYAQSYQSPVVLGQVQTYNDPDFSVFWSRGAAASAPASSSTLRVGKHIGEDTDTSRAAESVGYLVLEAGTATAGSATFTAGVGAATVAGIDNAPPYDYALSGLSAASVAVANLAGMFGDHGGWAVLYGADPVNATRLQLASDEDQALDSERVHVGENVSYLVFEDSALQLQDAPSTNSPASVTLEAVQSLVSQAVALWDTDGADDALDRLQIKVRDLSHNDLARVDATENTLLVDINAAGQGWFVDPTPAQREEYSFRAVDDLWTALENGPAAQRVDLLSVLAHELGHLMGHGHQHADARDVMSVALQAGVRRSPQPGSAEHHYQAAVDQALVDNATGERFDLTRLLASAW